MKIAVVGGGASPERDVSLRSAQRVASCLESSGHQTKVIDPAETSLVEAVREFVAHYHRERNHQGLKNALIEDARVIAAGRVQRQSPLGGLLNFYRRAA